MNNKEINDLVSKQKPIIKKAEQEITEMKVLLQKYKGDKTKPQIRIDAMENLLNLAVANQSRVFAYEDTVAQLIMNLGELNSKLKKVTKQLSILEQVSETSIDDVVNQIADRLK
jgi:hypothetical protein